MTTTEIQTKTYARLDSYIDKILTSFQTTGQIIKEYMNAAKEEGITENEAKAYLKEKIPKSTFYKYLPLEYKDPRKQSRVTHSMGVSGPPVDQKEEFNTKGMGVVIPESESSSESTTDANGEEKEQEVEQPYTPPIEPTQQPYHELKKEREQFAQRFSALQTEYDTIVRDKDKRIDEMAREMKAIQAANPDNQSNPQATEVVKSLQRRIEDLLQENEELREAAKPEFTAAKDLVKQTVAPPTNQIIILPHAMILELVRKRANTGINGIMKLTTEENIVKGIEVVNVQ